MKNIYIIMAFVSAMLSGCWLFNPFWENLEKEINDNKEKVFFYEIANYDWDIVCVLEPYSLGVGDGDVQISQYIPYDLGEFKDHMPDLDDDGSWAFAFIKNGKVISVEEKGYKFYLKKEYGENCLSRDVAAFEKVHDRSLEDYLIITDNVSGK